MYKTESDQSKLDKLFDVIDNCEEKLSSIGEKIDRKDIETKTKLTSIHPNNYHLLMKTYHKESFLDSQKVRHYYKFYDINDNVVFSAKESGTKFVLSNSKGKRIGKIVSKRPPLHNLVSIKKYYSYDVFIGKTKVGEIIYSTSLGKNMISFNEGEIKAEKHKKGLYKLIDKNNNLIAEIYRKFSFDFLDYSDKSNEILIVMMALVI